MERIKRGLGGDTKMTNKIDDSRMFETFRILEKYDKHPEDLTKKEKERLKELDIEA